MHFGYILDEFWIYYALYFGCIFSCIYNLAMYIFFYLSILVFFALDPRFAQYIRL